MTNANRALKKEKNMDTNLWSWFDQNLDVETRTIYMGSMGSTDGGEDGVDHVMAAYFIKGMHFLESRGKANICIIMNNIGGDWYHGMAIYDAIKCSPCVCTVKVYGYAMSMGSIILQAADERVMMPNSRFMIHYGTDGVYSHAKIAEKWGEEAKRNNHDMENIYLDMMMAKEESMGHGHLAKTITELVKKQKSMEYPKPEIADYKFSKNTTLKREEVRKVLKELLNFDTITTPEETVELGFADSIYTPEE